MVGYEHRLVLNEGHDPNQPTALAILGTSRGDGDTRAALERLLDGHGAPVIDLLSINLSGFDYAHSNRDDDFAPLARHMGAVELIILATPVYWYAMSAQMKTFIDRFSDLITIRKPLGRALAGRRLACLAVGTGASLPDGFEVPFRDTARYFDMQYIGTHYAQSGEQPGWLETQSAGLDAFARQIFG